MRRILAACLVFAFAACTPPATSDSPPDDASAGSTGVGRVPDGPFTLEAEALIGLWSFARDCGLYDLVFDAEDLVQYYDYVEGQPVVSYRGSWATAENNRVILSMRRIDMENEPTGDVVTYHLDVAAPVSDDLTGAFGPAGGAARDIAARRCEDEDRE